MYWLGAPFRFLYKVYFGVVYITSGIVLYPYFVIALRGVDRYKKAVSVKKLWSDVICFFCLLRVEVVDSENFPSSGPYIVCANHASYLDIIIMYKIIPGDFAFLGKAEVLKWPIISIFFRRGIDIPVDRSNRKKAAHSLLAAKNAIHGGRSLAIFPEGKMQTRPPKMERFKNGAFSLALEHQVPIVPITFQNNFRLFSDHTDVFGPGRPGKAIVLIHPPIKVAESTELISLRNLTHDTIKKGLIHENRP